MTSRQKSKDSLESATAAPYKKRKITLESRIMALSVLAIEIGFSTTFSQGFGSTGDSYKHAELFSR
jgi:hypothetical protein